MKNMLCFRLKKAHASWLLLLLPVFFFACRQSPPPQHPEKLPDAQQRLPQNALKGIQVDEGLYATLFASEPMITNPTNMDIDARGRVWMCEAFNYRPELNPGHPVKEAGDRIVILEDTTGDGVADTSKVFYQGPDVNAALGICVLGNKVIVSCSPKVFVFTDTDGDDKADKKEVLFEGIGGEQHDHGIHAFVFGPDGKLYFNFGNAGDSILDKNGNVVRDPWGAAVNNHGQPYRQGMVFRCDPDGSHFEVLGHNFRNNYEVAVDAFGTLWQSDNDDDGNRGVRINYVMEYGNYGYTDEMTGAGWRSYRINMDDSIPYRHWHLRDPGVVPNLLQTGSGSPTGMVVYEGDLLPAVFRNQMIHADALHNVVRSYPVEKDGAGYTARIVNIVEGEKYDQWFRPSDVCVAPDGSLFIADWYDPGVGGHQVGDLKRGRIFRIAPPGSSYKVTPPALDTPEEAVKALESPNLATRYLAWEKLHGWGAEAVPALEEMFGSDNPRYRARALWLLSKLPGQGMQYIQTALKDEDPDIRITALRAARQLPVDIIPLVTQVIHDPSPQVRRDAIIALHHNHSPKASMLWAELAKQYDGKDRWYLEALGIGADGQWDAYFGAWLRQVGGDWNTPAGRDIVWRSRAQAALPMLAQIIEDPSLDPEANLKFFRAFDFHKDSSRQQVLLGLLEGHHPRQSFINAMALVQLDAAGAPSTEAFRQKIAQSLESVKGRPEFVYLVQKYQVKDQDPALLEMALQSPSRELRSDAMDALLDAGGKPLVQQKLEGDTATAHRVIEVLGRSEGKVGKDLLQAYVLDKKHDTSLRRLATHALGRGWNGEDRLLALIDSRKLPHEVDEVARDILLHAYRSEVRTKAMDYFKVNGEGGGLPPVNQLVALHGNSQNGKAVFSSYCSTCHRVHNEGTDFGPNLSEIGGKLSKDALFTAVMHPDAGISYGFEGYLFRLKNGTQVLGYVSNETPEEVDVKVIGGTVRKLSPANILAREAYKHSLMPSGLAAAMGKDKLVNLVEYLSGLK